MGKPRRTLQAAADETISPPALLNSTQHIARVTRADGNNLYTCTLPSSSTVLVELAQRFRNTIWIKRGGFVIVDLDSGKDGEEQRINEKVVGEIVNVVREEKMWRRMNYWPKKFPRVRDEVDQGHLDPRDMPPSDTESDGA